MGFDGQAFPDVPPVTHWRRRPPMDFLDRIGYVRRRQTKYSTFFYQTTKQNLVFVMGYVVNLAVYVRLACLWLGAGPFFRGVFSFLGFGSTIATHQAWFQKSTSDMLVSEELLWNGFGVGRGLT